LLERKVKDIDLITSRNYFKGGEFYDKLKIHRQELSITKVEEKSDVSNNAYPMKPEAHPIASSVGG